MQFQSAFPDRVVQPSGIFDGCALVSKQERAVEFLGVNRSSGSMSPPYSALPVVGAVVAPGVAEAPRRKAAVSARLFHSCQGPIVRYRCLTGGVMSDGLKAGKNAQWMLPLHRICSQCGE